ncbi:MAG: serine hydrolase [Pyrinomonadaceae bacterium]|nr:serine hydrolase [Pyrinomonadaceae bacterium]
MARIHFSGSVLILAKTSRLNLAAPVLITLVLMFGFALGQRAHESAPIHISEDKQLTARLERSIPDLMGQGDIPGLSIALIRDAEVIWARGFGVKNSETKEAVDDNTVFEAASLSKPVFAYAVLKLVDSGKLTLDTPLTKYLASKDGKYDVGDDPRLDQITARRVLSHTTGFPNWRPRGDKTLKIHFTPGDRFSYSGEGFVYLAKIVEHISGETLDAHMKRAVFEPLGMKSSSYVWRDDYDSRKTFAHNSVGMVTGRGKPERANAAASLHTTANDYARFVVAIIKGTGLKPETVRLMLTPQISVGEAGHNSLNRPAASLSPAISWGLGWGLEKSDEGTAFWHWGDNGDTMAYVMAFDKQKTGVVMFANGSSGLSIIREVVDDTLGGQHPAISWIKYERYDSPARLMFKAILKSDAETVLRDYRKRPESSGENPKLTESQMNRLGYQLLGLKRVKDAIEVFSQNTVDFPEAFNTWDSLAEALMASGDKESAIRYYKKSLELNPENTNAVQKLKELGL